MTSYAPKTSSDGRAWLFVWGAVTGVGGTETRMAEAAEELSRRGSRVVSFIHGPGSDSDLTRILRASGSEVLQSRSWISLWRLLMTLRPRVILSFGLRPSLAARTARMATSRSSVLLMGRNGLDFGWKSWMFRLDRTTSQLMDGYFVNSQSVADHLAVHRIPAAKIHLVPSALGHEWAVPLKAAPLKQESAATFVIAMIGNRRPEKNQLFGLRAFMASGVTATLRIYTDDGTELREVISSEFGDASDRVEILETHRVGVEDYDAIDVLLHPSLSESLPRVVLEAVSRGCYVLASNVGDTRLHVTAGSGRVLDGFDLVSYADALREAVGTVSQPSWRRDLPPVRATAQYVDELESLVSQLAHQSSMSVARAEVARAEVAGAEVAGAE